MKKAISFFLLILTIFILTMPAASAFFDSGAVTSQLHSDIYYMENLDEGTVFFEKGSTEKVPIAGFAKVLAAVVALEKWGNLDGSIKLTKEHLNVFEYEYGMTTALYEEGETVAKKEIFDCLVVYSANDALSIIAYDISGTEEKFISEMQSLANKIGCTSTVLKNIHGFDIDGQYTTAQDVAKIIKYAVGLPSFNEAFSLEEITLKKTDKNEARTYYASNQMKNAAVADYYHSSVTGGRQTSTDTAGECIAVVSSADGYSYLTVVMGGKYEDIDNDDYDENTSMTDAQLMLDWVYDNIRFKVVASPEQTVAIVDVVAGKGVSRLELVPEKETSALVPLTASPASVMFEFVDGQAPKSVVAPIKAGEVVAQANVYYADNKLTTINVVAKEAVKLSFGGLVVTAFKSVIGSVFFLLLALIAASVAVLKFVLDLKDFSDKERRKSYDPLPSSFEVLVEKIKKALSFDKKKKSKPQNTNSRQKKNGNTPMKKKQPAPQQKRVGNGESKPKGDMNDRRKSANGNTRKKASPVNNAKKTEKSEKGQENKPSQKK